MFKGTGYKIYMGRKEIKMETIEELIYKETEYRLKEMGNKNYQFPEQADKGDAIKIVLVIVVCIILIILCMMGVIV